MGHHQHQHGSGESSNVGLAFFLNLIFTIIELVGGLYTNSLAILSDAVHDLGDSLSLGLAWYFQKVSNRPQDNQYTYGYKRYSVLGAIINSVILIIGSVFIIRAAIPRLLAPEETLPTGMVVLGILGILFNGLAYMKTHKGHSHNERVISLHLLEDVLGWVAVLIGAIVIHFTGWYIVDPILSLGIAAFILYNVVRQIKGTLNIILQATPENIAIEEIKSRILKLDSVIDIHDVHIWTMDGWHNILTAHLVVAKDVDMSMSNKIKMSVHEEMRHAHIDHCTLEIERAGEDCTLDHN